VSVTRKQRERFHVLEKVLKNHAISTPYMVQKSSINGDNCECATCALNIWKPSVIQDPTLYQQVQKMRMPTPIPKAAPEGGQSDKLSYMSFEDCSLQPFTIEHQPSMVAKQKAKEASFHESPGGRGGRGRRGGRGSRGGRTGRGGRVDTAQPEMHDNCLEISTPGGAPFHLQLARGTVQCKECAKPRVIFSLRAPSKMQPSHTSEEQPPSKADIAACMRIAKDVLQDAIASQDYVCGGQPLPEEHPFHDIFNTAQDLECHMHVEPQFYSKRGRTPQVASWSNPSLCSQCVGGLEATVAEGIPFSTILPLCDKCRGEGVKYPVRSRIRMSQARAANATHAA